jgi:hypothetical protein
MSFLVFCTIATGAFATRPIVTIPLDKQHVPVKHNERVVMNKTAYFGDIFFGEGHDQRFTVVFDTGSGHLMLPSVKCWSDTCRQHTQFDPALSQSPLKSDRIEILYGTGEVKGDSIRERVCLGQPANVSNGTNITGVLPNGAKALENAQFCVDLDMVLATEMTEQPFSAFEFDGVLGLGLRDLAVSPSYSFLHQIVLAEEHYQVPHMFGVFISEEDSIPSEISFGGYDEARMLSSLQWTPVNRPELGYWQVRINNITINEAPFPYCDDGTCVAILDSGTSSLGVPKPLLHDIHFHLARSISLEKDDELLHKGDCRHYDGPTLSFHLEGMTLDLEASDYSRPSPFHGRTNLLSNAADFIKNAATPSDDEPQSTYCRATLLPVTMEDPMPVKTFILGEPALKRYYTAYDWGEERVGFALASQPLSI